MNYPDSFISAGYEFADGEAEKPLQSGDYKIIKLK